MTEQVAAGVDVGGTKIAVGAVTESGEVLDLITRPTPDGPQVPAVVAQLVADLAREHEVVGVGIGAAGFVDADRRTVRFSANIDWVDMPLADEVAALTGLPVVVENDANAAAWGEHRFGVGAGARDLLFVTVGTGVGGGIVHRDRLFRGGSGVAAEIGHLRFVPDGEPCGCGQRGCLEQYASGRALVRSARERLEAGDEASAALAARCGNDPAAVTGPMVTALALEGDALSVTLLADLGRCLGEGIASLCAVLDPSIVVVGGGVADAGDLLLDPVRDALGKHLPAGEHRRPLQVVAATLGNRAGLIGAADLVRSDPA